MCLTPQNGEPCISRFTLVADYCDLCFDDWLEKKDNCPELEEWDEE